MGREGSRRKCHFAISAAQRKMFPGSDGKQPQRPADFLKSFLRVPRSHLEVPVYLSSPPHREGPWRTVSQRRRTPNTPGSPDPSISTLAPPPAPTLWKALFIVLEGSPLLFLPYTLSPGVLFFLVVLGLSCSSLAP